MSNKFTDFPSGLLDDFDLWITKASFGRDSAYNNGQTVQLFLKGKAYKDEVLVSDEFEIRYNLPPHWVSMDDGITVISEKDADNFQRSSQIAKLFMRVGECAPELIEHWFDSGLSPQDSVLWEGIGFHFKEITEGEPPYKSTKAWPVAYLGSMGTPESPGNPQTGDNGKSSEAEVIEQLRALAQQHESHETFVNAAIEIPGVSQYSNLVKRIADPDDLYAELRA